MVPKKTQEPSNENPHGFNVKKEKKKKHNRKNTRTSHGFKCPHQKQRHSRVFFGQFPNIPKKNPASGGVPRTKTDPTRPPGSDPSGCFGSAPRSWCRATHLISSRLAARIATRPLLAGLFTSFCFSVRSESASPTAESGVSAQIGSGVRGPEVRFHEDSTRVAPGFHEGLRGLRGGASTKKSTACCFSFLLFFFGGGAFFWGET